MTAKEFNRGRTSGTQGLTTLLSDFGPKETMDRLEAEVSFQGMKIFARINHSALAAGTGLRLRPTELLIFGNPRAGTPLMELNQTMGIDLPLKVLVWQDSAEKTWLTYNDLCWLVNRHAVGFMTERSVDLMALSLEVLARKVTEK